MATEGQQPQHGRFVVGGAYVGGNSGYTFSSSFSSFSLLTYDIGGNSVKYSILGSCGGGGNSVKYSISGNCGGG